MDTLGISGAMILVISEALDYTRYLHQEIAKQKSGQCVPIMSYALAFGQLFYIPYRWAVMPNTTITRGCTLEVSGSSPIPISNVGTSPPED